MAWPRGPRVPRVHSPFAGLARGRVVFPSGVTNVRSTREQRRSEGGGRLVDLKQTSGPQSAALGRHLLTGGRGTDDDVRGQRVSRPNLVAEWVTPGQDVQAPASVADDFAWLALRSVSPLTLAPQHALACNNVVEMLLQ